MKTFSCEVVNVSPGVLNWFKERYGNDFKERMDDVLCAHIANARLAGQEPSKRFNVSQWGEVSEIRLGE